MPQVTHRGEDRRTIKNHNAHAQARGKISLGPSKPTRTRRDQSCSMWVHSPHEFSCQVWDSSLRIAAADWRNVCCCVGESGVLCCPQTQASSCWQFCAFLFSIYLFSIREISSHRASRSRSKGMEASHTHLPTE